MSHCAPRKAALRQIRGQERTVDATHKKRETTIDFDAQRKRERGRASQPASHRETQREKDRERDREREREGERELFTTNTAAVSTHPPRQCLSRDAKRAYPKHQRQHYLPQMAALRHIMSPFWLPILAERKWLHWTGPPQESTGS